MLRRTMSDKEEKEERRLWVHTQVRGLDKDEVENILFAEVWAKTITPKNRFGYCYFQYRFDRAIMKCFTVLSVGFFVDYDCQIPISDSTYCEEAECLAVLIDNEFYNIGALQKADRLFYGVMYPALKEIFGYTKKDLQAHSHKKIFQGGTSLEIIQRNMSVEPCKTSTPRYCMRRGSFKCKHSKMKVSNFQKILLTS